MFFWIYDMFSHQKKHHQKKVKKTAKKQVFARKKDRIVFDKPIMGLAAYFKKTGKKSRSTYISRQAYIIRPLALVFLALASSSTVAFYFLILKDLPNPRELV